MHTVLICVSYKLTVNVNGDFCIFCIINIWRYFIILAVLLFEPATPAVMVSLFALMRQEWRESEPLGPFHYTAIKVGSFPLKFLIWIQFDKRRWDFLMGSTQGNNARENN